MIKISPSILSADFANLALEIQALDKAGADMIHIDVMDGNFVPSITIGPIVVQSIKQYTKLPFDVHLMVQNPEKHIEQFAKAGADIITIHYEATENIENCISLIKSFNKMVGISLKPETNYEVLYKFIYELDLILIMTVSPGASGQKFMSDQLIKIREIAKKIKSLDKEIILSVDGGINDITAKYCYDEGASMLVAGSFIFNGKDYKEKINSLKMVI